MDRFSEQLVQKEATGKDMFLRGLMVAGAMAIFFLALFFMWTYLILVITLAGVIGWGLVLLLKDTVTEYEYIVTNDDLDIDKIIGRRKRKRLVTLSLRSVKSIEPYSSGDTISADVVVMAHDETGVDMYVLLCEHKSYGELAVVFNPDARTLENMTGGFAPEIKAKYAELYIKNEKAEDETGEKEEEKAADTTDES